MEDRIAMITIVPDRRKVIYMIIPMEAISSADVVSTFSRCILRASQGSITFEEKVD